jgi:SAM-dependent methyltransferase
VKDAHKVSSQIHEPLFENPFSIEDLMIFDDATLQRMLEGASFGLTPVKLAHCLHSAPLSLVEHIEGHIPPQEQSFFLHELYRPLPAETVESTRHTLLDALFWELTYWKTPDLYETLTEGEQLHPGIFQQLEPDIRGKTVLDVGAGSGRASFASVRCGAKRVYAVEPSPGLLRILRRKRTSLAEGERIIPAAGTFNAIPLAGNSVDITLSCSAFTALAEQGGEAGLEEMKRVTRPGGKIVIIWPRVEDRAWLTAHGFQYVALPLDHEMIVYFRSLESALCCARRFYAHNTAVARYILSTQRPQVPFSVLGVNPPCDYCWLKAG